MTDEMEAMKAMEMWANPMFPPVFDGWRHLGTVDGGGDVYAAPVGSALVVPINSELGRQLIRGQGVDQSDGPLLVGERRAFERGALPESPPSVPMWAVDVNKSRRPRRNRCQPNSQGIA